jgi:hypothetical protein
MSALLTSQFRIIGDLLTLNTKHARHKLKTLVRCLPQNLNEKVLRASPLLFGTEVSQAPQN